jgi:RNA polymerase sigma-54 factor
LLKTIQGQALQQKLSPQAIQAQLLLAIPTLALDQEIKKQIEDNPVLEDEIDSEIQSTLDDYSKLEEAYSADSWNRSPSNYSREDSEERTEYLINKQNRQKETPLEQVYNLGLENTDLLISEEILGSLESDGYLRITLDEISKSISDKYGIETSIEEIESVLKVIQKLDPPGIAARDLAECLSIQLNELPIDEYDRTLCLKMINEYFEDFRHKHFEKLAKNLGVGLNKINELFEIIHRLNPVPGKQDTTADYIYPDFLIKNIEGKIFVELNGESNPGVKISKKYMDMLKDKKTPRDTKEFLKNKLESARWFLNSIQSRKETLLKVMNAIIKRQKEFFVTRGENLKPLYEKDIADDINMDISTVSRVVRGKYAQTDFGIYELKYFFSGSLKTDSGEDISSKIVKEKIRVLIHNEDKSKPLSDDKITDIMNSSGFNIARRTVAKYREAMKIPKATLRRQIKL